jgi:hypothetical protein
MNKIVGFYLYFICISYEYCMHESTCPKYYFCDHPGLVYQEIVKKETKYKVNLKS